MLLGALGVILLSSKLSVTEGISYLICVYRIPMQPSIADLFHYGFGGCYLRFAFLSALFERDLLMFMAFFCT